VSATVYRNVRLWEWINTVCMGVQTGFCEGGCTCRVVRFKSVG